MKFIHNDTKTDKYGNIIYYSKENRTNVFLAADITPSSYGEDVTFYDDEAEEFYRGCFEFNDGHEEQLESQNVKKKTYPN